jgi:outer membrane protein
MATRCRSKAFWRKRCWRTRSILDILNAEQELLNAQVNLVTARRSCRRFRYRQRCWASTVEKFIPTAGRVYDPTVGVNYRRVRRSINDWQ